MNRLSRANALFATGSFASVNFRMFSYQQAYALLFRHPSGSDAPAVTCRKQSTSQISSPVTHDDHRLFSTCNTLCNRHLASISLHTVAHVPLAPSGIKDWNHRSVILTDNSGIKALAYVLGRDKYIRWCLLIISGTMMCLVCNIENCRIWDVVNGRLVRKFKISGGGKCVLQREHAEPHTLHIFCQQTYWNRSDG